MSKADELSRSIDDAVREGALKALRRRIEAIGETIRFARLSAEKDGVETIFLTSDGAHAARLKAELEDIAREVETLVLS